MVTINNNNELNIFHPQNDLFQSLAIDFIQRAHNSIRVQNKFTVVLSGGNTPKLFFDALVEINSHTHMINWDKILFFFSDERYVSIDNTQNNYKMTYEHLFSKLPIPLKNIYRILTEFKHPNDAARDYELTIRSLFHCHDDEFPRFDVVYLGLGEDAHTASLMPFSDVVMHYCQGSTAIDHYQLVESLWVPEQNMYRITLTPPAINHASNIIFTVTGKAKATAVYETLNGDFKPQQFPAQLIHCVHNKNTWYLDKEAACRLTL